MIVLAFELVEVKRRKWLRNLEMGVLEIPSDVIYMTSVSGFNVTSYVIWLQGYIKSGLRLEWPLIWLHLD